VDIVQRASAKKCRERKAFTIRAELCDEGISASRLGALQSVFDRKIEGVRGATYISRPAGIYGDSAAIVI
jgi:hypothetical protein